MPKINKAILIKEISTLSYATDDQRHRAQILAQELNLTLDNNAIASLHLMPEQLTLKMPNCSLLAANFTKEISQRRKLAGKSQGLIRACKPKPGLKIVDATAGWGRDALILAASGAQVLMLERHPIMAALLRDALQYKEDSLCLSLLEIDACTYFNQLKAEEYPDLIYIDPMHPERQKSALVKKDLHALQQLIGPEQDAGHLIECAMKHVHGKVVVKWPQKLKPALRPHSSVAGKTVRFDVFSGIG